MNKKAIELSINFLVIVIISIIMLSTGLLLVKKYFGTAEEIKTQLDEQTVAQIENLLDEGASMAIPLKRKTVYAGESEIFGLGVLNVNPSTATFIVDVDFSSAFRTNKAPIELNELPTHPVDWLLYEKSFSLAYREKKSIPIRVSVPKGIPSGTYIYNVKVDQYANKITKIYVIVP